MDISARADYAVRALLVLAEDADGDVAHPADELARRAGVPAKFLEAILGDLRRAGFVTSRRGSRGGYLLARDPHDVTLGSVLRTVDGPLAEVRGQRPHETHYDGAAQHLATVWVAARAALRDILDETTLADVLAGDLPAHVRALAEPPEAWQSR
ncbi:RrF2 family transcriptional regulator [Phycicoccus sonneratiae]|uniref:Rrf2 family transcriptional regulator n=1 Tax=Phycicoccus sonneratiae TaxID=2807628 RepID=A0ABS2CKN5_9MICO|nr:Rrf2 family transcriptional regulator [Phycicoccus sonneraticus]MBM6400442.1 Rrf2 family transcriptional regulator [Phycicoccus sonneraticus]